jgi:hypothetical protein
VFTLKGIEQLLRPVREWACRATRPSLSFSVPCVIIRASRGA